MRRSITLGLVWLLSLSSLHLLTACRQESSSASDHAGHSPVPVASAAQTSKMSMPASPVDPTGHAQTPAADLHAGHSQSKGPVAPAIKLAGRSAVMITPEKQQLIGLQTVTITRKLLKSVMRTVGRVDYNEQEVSHVHTKVEGWIEKLYADFTGQWVRKGQPLLEIYSPDLLAAQKEYLLALQTQKQLRRMAAHSEFGISAADNASLVEASRQKLLLWDLQPAQIQALERSGQVHKTVTLYAPSSGNIIEKKALTGMQVMPGMELYTLANLSTVWVQAQVYEYELPRVRVGQHASMQLSYLPGVVFNGQVSYIYPTLDPRSRTAMVRIIFANPAGQLKPEMYSEVTIETASGQAQLAIPVDAVIDSGTRKLVFVAKPGGYFEPREIVTGMRIGDFYQVLSGVKEKERVVASANFLVDSESQLKAAAGGMGGHGH